MMIGLFVLILLNNISTLMDQSPEASSEVEMEDKGLKGYAAPSHYISNQDEPSSKLASLARFKWTIVMVAMAIVLIAVYVNSRPKNIDYCKDLRERYSDAQLTGTQTSPTIQLLPSVIVDVTYPSQDGSVPIDLLRKDKQGKGVEDVLYKNDATRFNRNKLINQRFSYFDTQTDFKALHLAKYNIINSEEQQKEAVEANQRDWLRLQAKFNLSAVTSELPMCILVPCFNNNAQFRIQANLNSIFTQNYTNYKVIIIEDASPDGSDEVYRNYFAHHAIDKQRYTYIENLIRLTTLPNLYFGAMNHCGNDSVVLHVDGDDELIGRNTLKVFNWAYQTKKAGVVYSNYYWYLHQRQSDKLIVEGITKEYSDAQKRGNLYRQVEQKFSHLRSYRAELLFQIDPKDLQGKKGDFYPYTADQALLLPLMELACARVHKIQGQFHYLYNRGKWNLGVGLYSCAGDQINAIIRKKKKRYQCYKQFDERMQK